MVLLEPGCVDAGDLERFLRDYLTQHPDGLTTGPQAAKTELKRLIKIYDWMRYGRKEEPPEGGS